LVDSSGFAGGYQSVKRFIRNLRGKSSQEACAVIETAAGEECQVDYGSGPPVRDAASGKYRRTRLFVLTLGYSHKAVRLLAFRSSSQIWAELHEKAFRRLGGLTRVVVLDNLREGVLKPDVYDPALNPLYRDVLSHYGSVALACRVRDPDRKGKVESGVGHVKKTPLKGQRFESLEEAQAYLDHWEERWADTRIHGTTKRQVAAMFAEEKPALLPLPLEPFRYYQYGKRRVNLDGCVEVEAAYYSAPPGWIGEEVPVQWDHRYIRLLHPQTANCCGSTCLRCVASIGSKTKTDPNKHRRGHNTCCCAPAGPASRLAWCVAGCTRRRGKSPCAAFRACWRWPRGTAQPWWMTPAPWPWRSALRTTTVLFAAIWSEVRNCL
jgi:transposase